LLRISPVVAKTKGIQLISEGLESNMLSAKRKLTINSLQLYTLHGLPVVPQKCVNFFKSGNDPTFFGVNQCKGIL
jgi:hypothetical protein